MDASIVLNRSLFLTKDLIDNSPEVYIFQEVHIFQAGKYRPVKENIDLKSVCVTSKVDLHPRLAQPRMLTNMINIVHIDCFEMGIFMFFIYISLCIDVTF